MVVLISNGKMIGCMIDGETLLCDQCSLEVKQCEKSKKTSAFSCYDIMPGNKKSVLISRPKRDEKSPYHEVAKRIADLVTDKQIKYGDSFGRSHRILEELYPDGISKDQYKDVLVLIRIIDKIYRISRGDQGDESAWDDINGYSLLAATRKWLDENKDLDDNHYKDFEWYVNRKS